MKNTSRFFKHVYCLIPQIRRTSDSCSRRSRTPSYSPIWRSTIWFRRRNALMANPSGHDHSFSRILTNVSVWDCYSVDSRSEKRRRCARQKKKTIHRLVVRSYTRGHRACVASSLVVYRECVCLYQQVARHA